MIRLGCDDCETTKHDMIDPLEPFPEGWENVRQIQTYQQSLETEATVFNCKRFSVFDWETHVGLCPECQGRKMERTERNDI